MSSAYSPRAKDAESDFDEVLDPRLRDSGQAMTAQQVAQLPRRLLSEHPYVLRLEEEINSLTESRDRLTDKMRDLKRKLREMEDAALLDDAPTNPPVQGKNGSASASKSDASDWRYNAAASLHPKKIMWHKSDVPVGATKEEFTLDHEGESVGAARCGDIEKATALQCAFIYADDFAKENLKHLPQKLRSPARAELNYAWLTKNCLDVIVKQVCIPLEKQFPELGYCTGHYKSLRYVHAHIKSKIETVRKAVGTTKARSTASGSSTLATERGSKTKDLSTVTQASVDKGKKRAISDDEADISTRKRAKSSFPDVRHDDEFSEASSEDDTRPKKPTRKQLAEERDPVRKLQARFGSAYMKDDSSDDDNTGRTGASQPPRKNAALNPRPAFASSKPASSIPSSSSSKNVVEAAAESLSGMRAIDAAILTPPTVKDLEKAMQDRYSGLDQDDKAAVAAALRAVDGMEARGRIPKAAGDPSFERWLVRIEGLREDSKDEDLFGPSFGHKAVGEYDYKNRLKNIEAWGGSKNALRLLAALLRMYRMSKEQIGTMENERSGPLARVYVVAAANLIAATFKTDKAANVSTPAAEHTQFGNDITNSIAGPSRPSSGPTANSSAADNGDDNQAVGSSTVKKDRNRIAKELQGGKVTEAALRSLSKKAALPLLGPNAVKNVKATTKEEVLDRLVQAWQTNKISLTAKQIIEARAGIRN
ncbi:hypothetical protein OC844_006479 [Tilletia horrida]|nr:hypothetical protein OC844_006479 [Tilletia horrida]